MPRRPSIRCRIGGALRPSESWFKCSVSKPVFKSSRKRSRRKVRSMRTIARFMDARNTTEGKFLSVLLSVLLVFSFLNVTMFTDYATPRTRRARRSSSSSRRRARGRGAAEDEAGELEKETGVSDGGLGERGRPR